MARSLSGKGLRGKTVNVKLRLSDFTTFTRQVTLPEATASEEAMLEVGWGLAARELAPGRAFRLIGVGMSSLQDPEGMDPSREESQDDDPAPEVRQLTLPLFGPG